MSEDQRGLWVDEGCAGIFQVWPSYAAAPYDWPGGWGLADDSLEHERLHRELGEEHQETHGTLGALHEEFHEQPHSARQHRQFHRNLRRLHRGLDRGLAQEHRAYHD
ncbi:MAG TPA: hypothetical protein VGX03_00645 [Candidatus Binatia bacterium]|nr:hypothetical protein [Candidatus Binatia bacterium]